MPEGDEHLEVAEVARERTLHVLAEVLVLHARDADRADARDVDHAVAIDHRAVVDVDLAPGADLQFVARSDDVVRRHCDVLDRREGGRPTFEELLSEHRQAPAGRLLEEVLELVAFRTRERLKDLRARVRLLRERAGPLLTGGPGDVGYGRGLER